MLMCESIAHLAAERELTAAQAAGYGAVLAAGSEKARPQLNRYVRRLVRTSFPTERRAP